VPQWLISGHWQAGQAETDAGLPQYGPFNAVLRRPKCNLFDRRSGLGQTPGPSTVLGVPMSPARDFLRAAVILGVVVLAVAWAFRA
jgi:hypothetical protein